MLRKIGLRKIGFILLSASAAITTNAYSMVTNSLVPGITVEYDLPPNEPQVFANYMFWTIEAHCTIASVDDSNDLFAKAISKKGKINDVLIAAGQSLSLTVRQGEVLKLSAESGAKVEITNKGQHLIKATCST
ncbi:MAG TPA: hypothetical protein PK657_05715 [Legionella sp.]|nr:hypothetical protein [Legionella sp.]